jgi:hypothetical protein
VATLILPAQGAVTCGNLKYLPAAAAVPAT